MPSSTANDPWNHLCGAPQYCYDAVTDPNKNTLVNAYATFVLSGGTWVLQNVWCPATAQPIPTTEALREQAIRLLPKVQIGSAWTHRAIVNAQTVLWATTDANRTLPTATVVGRRVRLRIAFDHANWNFGDGATDTTTDPGKPYDETGDPCAGARCPDYYGHTYTTRGAVTVTLTVAWHAEFSLNNGTTWTAIDAAPLTGPATTHQLDLVQERGVLVPDP
jgi:hypothetical protein